MMGRVRGRPSSPGCCRCRHAPPRSAYRLTLAPRACRGAYEPFLYVQRCGLRRPIRRRCAHHSTMKRSLLILCAAAATIVPSSFQARAADAHGRYFMVVRAYQSPENDVVKAHTFVSFYRGDELSKAKSTPPTISWLPASGNVHIFGAERGRNFSLAQTLAIARRTGREVKLQKVGRSVQHAQRETITTKAPERVAIGRPEAAQKE